MSGSAWVASKGRRRIGILIAIVAILAVGYKLVYPAFFDAYTGVANVLDLDPRLPPRVKSIVRPEAVSAVDIHLAFPADVPAPGQPTRTYEVEVRGVAQLSHYYTRSWEEFEAKRFRGSATGRIARPAVDFDLPIERVTERYELLRWGGGGDECRLICVVVRFDHAAAARVVDALPPVLHLDAWEGGDDRWLAALKAQGSGGRGHECEHGERNDGARQGREDAGNNVIDLYNQA